MNTSMHSSGMHTTHLLTVSQHALHTGVVYPSMHWVWGYLPRVVSVWVVSAQGVCSRHPPLNRMTDRQV